MMDDVPRKEYFRFYMHEWCRGRSARDIHEALNEVWPDHCPGYSTVARTVSQFASNARTSFSYAERSGRPASGDDNCGIVPD